MLSVYSTGRTRRFNRLCCSSPVHSWQSSFEARGFITTVRSLASLQTTRMCERSTPKGTRMGVSLKLFVRIALAFAGLLLVEPNCIGQAPSYDLLLKGGHVIDPADNV